MYNFIKSIYFVVTIVYDKWLTDNTGGSVLSIYDQVSGSSISDCVLVCEKVSKCVVTIFYKGGCFHYKLSNGAVKAAINGLPINDIKGAAYAIKQ